MADSKLYPSSDTAAGSTRTHHRVQKDGDVQDDGAIARQASVILHISAIALAPDAPTRPTRPTPPTPPSGCTPAPCTLQITDPRRWTTSAQTISAADAATRRHHPRNGASFLKRRQFPEPAATK
ncbi:MAG: hypothetical protein QM602_05550 [Microbacterium sp.]